MTTNLNLFKPHRSYADLQRLSLTFQHLVSTYYVTFNSPRLVLDQKTRVFSPSSSHSRSNVLTSFSVHLVQHTHSSYTAYTSALCVVRTPFHDKKMVANFARPSFINLLSIPFHKLIYHSCLYRNYLCLRRTSRCSNRKRVRFANPSSPIIRSLSDAVSTILT